MEAKQYVKIVTLLALVFLPALVLGYDDTKTHPLLTSKAVSLFETSEQKSFSEADRLQIVQGAKDEDNVPRWLEHFYDPINNVGLNNNQFATSKKWAHGQNSTGNDYSWENAIYEYTYGDKQKGLYALGHVLHLVQDVTVPDHTRDDAHPLLKTYEDYAYNQTLVASSNLIAINSLDDYFDQVASFTNANFFSDDTILKNYDDPKIIKTISEKNKDGITNIYGYNNYGKLVWVNKWWDENAIVHNDYSLVDTDNKVMSDYWDTLAPKAVGYSAGVIKLFLAEVEKEKISGVIKEARTPWWLKIFATAQIKIDQMLASINLFNSVTPTIPTSTTTPAVASTSPVTTPLVVIEENEMLTLAQLEIKLRQLQAQLDALAEISEAEAIPITGSIGHSLSVAETILGEIIATSTATTTATTTEEILSPETPTVTLSVDNCAWSLSSLSCLLITTSTLRFSWAEMPAGDYIYDLSKLTRNVDDREVWDRGVVYSGADKIFEMATGIDPANYPIEFGWQVEMKLASTSEVVASSSIIFTTFHPRPLVINEIGWAGTAASSLDEWFELRNYLSGFSLDLENYYLSDNNKTWQINLSGPVLAEGYYLAERGSDEVVSNRPAQLVDNFITDIETKAFVPASLGLKLWHKTDLGDELIDETPVWDKTGSASSSLERTWEDRLSTELLTWEVNEGCNETDGPCALDRNATTTFGTPGVINLASIVRLW